MLKQIKLQNFTVFKSTNIEIADGLNVIVGENGSGKTHLLKLGYLISTIWEEQVKNKNLLSKEEIERHISNRLMNIFKPDKIGNLTSSDSKDKTVVTGRVKGTIPTVSITLPGEKPNQSVEYIIDWEFQFSAHAKKSAKVNKLQKRLTSNARYGSSVYLPSKEMVSFFDGFLALYDNRELHFDETFKDLALKLSSPKLRNKPKIFDELLCDLSLAVGGEMVLEGGRFYTISESINQKREITLLAEGLRKLATIMQLIENGNLKPGGTLFWDEPDSNMNPRLIRLVAKTLIKLSNAGIQIIIATHSLFLLRELDILSSNQHREFKQKYFSLKVETNKVSVKQCSSVDELDTLILLDESLLQSERFIKQG